MSLDGSELPQPSTAEAGALSPAPQLDALDTQVQGPESQGPESQIGQGNLGRIREAQQAVALTEQGVVRSERETAGQLADVYALSGKLSEAVGPKKFPITTPFGSGLSVIVSRIDRKGEELLGSYRHVSEVNDLTVSQVVREHQYHQGEFVTPDGNSVTLSTYDTRFKSFKKDSSGRMVPDGEPKPGFSGLFRGVRITDPSLPEGSELILGQSGGHATLRISRKVDGREVDLFSIAQSGLDNEGVQFGGNDPQRELQDDAEWIDLAQRRIQYSLDHAAELTLKNQATNTSQTEPSLSQSGQVDVASIPVAPQVPSPGV